MSAPFCVKRYYFLLITLTYADFCGIITVYEFLWETYMLLHFKKITGGAWQGMQTVVCFVLITVMLVMSFGNLYTVRVEVPRSLQNGMDRIEEVLNDPLVSGGEELRIVMPEELNINLLLFIRSSTKIKGAVEIYKSMVEFTEVSAPTNTSEYYQAYVSLRDLAADAKELVASDEFVDLLALASTLISGLSISAQTASITS